MLADRETLERADELVRQAWRFLRPRPFDGIDRAALVAACADNLGLEGGKVEGLMDTSDGTLELARELEHRARSARGSGYGRTLDLLETVCLVHVRQDASEGRQPANGEERVLEWARAGKESVDRYRQGYGSVPRDPRVGGLLGEAPQGGDDYLAGWNAGVRDARRLSETYLRDRAGRPYLVCPEDVGPSLFRMTGDRGTFELVPLDTLEAVPGATMAWAGDNRAEYSCGDAALYVFDWGPGSESRLRSDGGQMRLDVLLGERVDLPEEVARTTEALAEVGRHAGGSGGLWPGSSYLGERERRERRLDAGEAADLLPEGYGNDLSGVTESRRERRLHMPYAEDPYGRTTLAKNDYEDQVAQMEGDGQEAMLGVDVDAEVTDARDNYALALEEARRRRQDEAPEPEARGPQGQEHAPERDARGRQR